MVRARAASAFKRSGDRARLRATAPSRSCGLASRRPVSRPHCPAARRAVDIESELWASRYERRSTTPRRPWMQRWGSRSRAARLVLARLRPDHEGATSWRLSSKSRASKRTPELAGSWRRSRRGASGIDGGVPLGPSLLLRHIHFMWIAYAHRAQGTAAKRHTRRDRATTARCIRRSSRTNPARSDPPHGFGGDRGGGSRRVIGDARDRWREAAVVPMTAERSVLCPMDTEVRSVPPGRCPLL